MAIKGGINDATGAELDDLNTDLDYQSAIFQQEDQVGDLPGTLDQSNYSVFTPVNTVSDIWQSFQQSIPGFISTIELTNQEGFPFTADLTIYSGVGTGGSVIHTDIGITLTASDGLMTLTSPPNLPADTPYTMRCNNFSSGTVSLYKNSGVYTRGSSDLAAGEDYLFKTYSSLENVIEPITNPNWNIICGEVQVYEDVNGVKYMRSTYDASANTITTNYKPNPGGSGGTVILTTLADVYPYANWSIRWGDDDRINILETHTEHLDTLVYGWSAGESQIPNGGTIQNHNARVKYYTIKSNTPATTTTAGNLNTPRKAGETVTIVGSDDTRPVKVPTVGLIKTDKGRPVTLGNKDSISFMSDGTNYYETSRSVVSAGGYDPSYINVHTDNVTTPGTPPTGAELTTIFGTVSKGFIADLHPANDTNNYYVIRYDGTNWRMLDFPIIV